MPHHRELLESGLTYLSVAPLPHANAVVFGVAGIWGLRAAVRAARAHRYAVALIITFATFAAFGIALFAEADARSRFYQYRRVRHILARHGWKPRIVEPLLYSRCQRDAARVTAAQTGYRDEIDRYFYEQGYRWYHVIPDALVKDPTYFFNRQFLQSSFFVRNHRKS